MTTTTDRTGDDIAAALRTIRTSWDQMIRVLGSPERGHVTGSRQPPAPIPVNTLSVRYDTDATLTSWARLTIEQRGLVTRPEPGGVCEVAGFLMIHADWLAHHDAGAACADELARAGRGCHDIAVNRHTGRIPCGPCPETPCTGKLTGLLTARDDDQDILPDAVTCSANPAHRWATWQWVALGRRVRYSVDTEAA